MVLLVCLFATSCGLRAGDVVLIPSGYRGWVVIRYGVAGQPRLSHTGLKILIRVPSSGSVETSSNMKIGYGVDEYYYVNDAGKRLLIPSDLGDGCKPQDVCAQHFRFYTSPGTFAVFFVGTTSELSKYPEPQMP